MRLVIRRCSAILGAVARASADRHTARPKRLARMEAAIVGPRSIRRLTITHAVDDFADSMITLSLIGSLFFSVSLEASRSRILLYLLLTVAPLAIVAQVVGPAIDRIRAGPRFVVICSHIARAVFALLLASSLLSLAFYPLVFGILLSRKAYGLAMKAMVAQMAPEQTELVAASGHLARTGTIAGGIGTAVGGAMILLVGVQWLPVVGAFGFVGAAILASRVPAVVIEARVESVVIRVETPVEVRREVPAVATIRAAEGALTFLLALSIKRGGGDEWIFVAALVAAGVGTFMGTIVSPRLYRVFSSDGIVVLTLLIPGVMSLFGVLTIGSLSIVAIAFAIGLGGSVATRAMDATMAALHLMRGRIIFAASCCSNRQRTGAAIGAVSRTTSRSRCRSTFTVGGVFTPRSRLLHTRQTWLPAAPHRSEGCARAAGGRRALPSNTILRRDRRCR